MKEKRNSQSPPTDQSLPMEGTAYHKWSSFARLVLVTKKLRDPKEGCPWDLKQTHSSLKEYAIEEAYEVCEAIDEGTPKLLKKELGDYLFQAILHAQIAEEHDEFNIGDVCQAMSEKLIERHPHIFDPDSGIKAKTAKEVENNWEALKVKIEKKESVLEGVPKALPSLQRANRLSEKAARIGFDFPDEVSVFEKCQEEFTELTEALESKDPSQITHELGDCFFALANLARKLELNPEAVLQKANDRFIGRFSFMEKLVKDGDKEISNLTLDELEAYWLKAKENEKKDL